MKRAILFAVLLVGSIPVFCQGISGGIKMGMNAAKESFSYTGVIYPGIYTGYASTQSSYYRANFVGGFYLRLMLTRKLGVQPELLYSGEGGTGYSSPFSAGAYTDKYTYLNVPVVIRYQIFKILNIHAGPQFGTLLGAKETLTNFGPTSITTTTYDLKHGTTLHNLGLVLGAGIDLPAGFNFTARYITGLSNIYPNGPHFFGVFNDRNRVIQVTAGYRLFGTK